MTNTFVVFVCCLVVTLVYSEEVRTREELENECKEELKVRNGEGNDNQHDLGCLYECMHKKAGFLNADGTLNVDKLKGFPYILTLSLNYVHRQCIQSANGDSCGASLCLEEIASPMFTGSVI